MNKKSGLFISVIMIVVILGFLVYYFHNNPANKISGSNEQSISNFDGCPPEGNAQSETVRQLNRLKNRSNFPLDKDFDTTISLEKILAPGNDVDRWNSDKAIMVTGYVADVKIGGVETCNCKAKGPEHRDTHIELVIDPMNFVDNQKMIVEVTPRMRKLMSDKNEDWSTRTLRDKILGRWIKVKGWMLFDFEHQMQAENTNPGNPKNWRGTSWEIHPVTSIEVVNRPR